MSKFYVAIKNGAYALYLAEGEWWTRRKDQAIPFESREKAEASRISAAFVEEVNQVDDFFNRMDEDHSFL